MQNRWIGGAALMVLLLGALTVGSQPPDRKGQPDKKGPPPYEPGKVLPPFVREGIDLTDEQEKQLTELEADVKKRLLKILTPEQLKKIATLRPGRPGGPGGPDDLPNPGKGKGKEKEKEKGKGKGKDGDKGRPEPERPPLEGAKPA